MNNPGVVNPGCKSIKHIQVRFEQHTKRACSNAHVKSNNTHSHSPPEVDDLFATKDRLKVDKQCIENIQNETIVALTKHELGQPTSDTASWITNLPVLLKLGDECAPPRQPMDLAFILDEAVANNRNHTCLWLHTDQMHFLPEFDPLKIKQWGPQIEDQMLLTPEKTPNMDETNVLTPEFQKLAVNMTRGKVASPQMAAQSTASALANGHQFFNVNQLPTDVRLQHCKKSGNQLIDGNWMKPFITSIPTTQNPNKMRTCHHHLDPPGIGHRLITRDGTVFHLRDHGAKSNEMFIKSAPVCRDNLAADVWEWHIAFTQFAASKGKHVHPHFCF